MRSGEKELHAAFRLLSRETHGFITTADLRAAASEVGIDDLSEEELEVSCTARAMHNCYYSRRVCRARSRVSRNFRGMKLAVEHADRGWNEGITEEAFAGAMRLAALIGGSTS